MILNDIITGIAEAIGEEFSEGYKIYTENVEQGLVAPCFSVVCVSPLSRRFLGRRHYKENKFCIHYYAGTSDARGECLEVFDRLVNCLRRISVSGDLINGGEITAEGPEDGVLHVFVNYNLFMYETDDTETMDGYTYKNEVRDNG